MTDNIPDWARSSQPVTTPAPHTSVPAWADPNAGETGIQRLTRGHSDPTHPNLWNVIYGLQGAYEQSALSGLMAEPTRAVMEGVGYGKDELKRRYPNQTEDWYKRQLHNAYNIAITDGREDAANKVAANPYPGHQVGNFAAGVLGSADPTWAIPVPGVNGLTRAPARIAATAAMHGGLTAASDAAAQGMDMLEGQKKDFDVKRNLEAAAFGSAFGGAIGGLGEVHNVPAVSDFVAGLFGKRGVDTLPAANPRASTSPLTTERPTMTPEQHAQLGELVKTGSVDDIKNFLVDKQGPKPTWSDVNELVKTRDAIPEGTLPNFQEAVNSHLDRTHAAVVKDHIEAQMSDWKNKPDVEVVHRAEDIADPEVRKSSVKQKLNADNTVGFVGPDGKVRVFAGAVKTPEQASAVLFHEGLGHFGLAQKFGAGLDKTLETLMTRNVGQFGKDVAAWVKANPKAYKGNKLRAAEEVLAEMSQEGPLKKSLADALESHVRRFGRQMGMKLSYSDAEIRNILSMAHDAVINGKGRDVAGNGFKFKSIEESDNPWMHPDENPFPKGRGEMPEGDVKQVMSEHANNASAFDPATARSIPDEDVHQIMSENDDGFRFSKKDDEDAARLIAQARELGVDTNSIPELRNLQKMNKFHGEFQDTIAERAKAIAQRGREAHEDGRLPFTVGTKFSTEHSRRNGSPPWEVTGHYVDAKDGRYGYHVKRSVDGDEERSILFAGGGKSPLGNSYEDLAKSFQPFTGPSEVKFMTPDQLNGKRDAAEQIHEDAFTHFGDGYSPKFRSIEEAEKAASNTALNPSAVKKSKSVGHLDRKLFVYDNAAKEANAKMMLLHAKAQEAGGLSHEDMADLIETANSFHYVLGRLDNDLGEVGRALNAAKAITFRRGNILELKAALEGENSPLSALMDPENAEKFLKQFAAMSQNGNSNGAANLLKGVNQPYWWQYLLTWRSNMLLSGLSTHLKNPMDMATTAGRELEEKLAALPMGALRDMARSVGMKNVQQGVHPAEVVAHTWGITRALLSASTYKDAANAFKSGGYQRFGVSGIQNPRIPVVSKVTDALAAMDVFFRTILDNGNLHALGVREARKSGLTSWDDITTAAAGHAMHPTLGMLKEAKELSEHTMLINESALNDAINRAKRIRPGMNGLEQFSAFATNYLTPFIRVQSNALINQIVRRSPLSFLDPITRADFKAGGARRDIAISRTVIGSALMAMYWQAAGAKKITDQGPDNDFNKLQEMEASGWRPGATHDKGRFNTNGNLNLSLNPFDLHNNVASLVAGVREAYDQGASKHNVALSLKLSAASIMSALTKQTFVNDIGEAWDAFRSPGETGSKKAARFLGNEAKTFLPNATTQAAKMVDPVARDTSQNPIVDIPHSAVPFWSKTLPAQHTTYGEEKKTGTGLTGVHTWFSQGNGQNEVTDPVHVEMARLGDLFDDTLVGPVQRTITGKDINRSRFKPEQITDAGNVRLTAEQFQEFQRMAGEDITEHVRDAMASPNWADMSDEEKAARVHKISTNSKKAVKRYLYGHQN